MKALVVYSSQTNNTKKLAEAAAAELNAEIVSVGAAGDISGYDHIVVGFWLKGGGPDPATQEFLPKLSGKKVFLFATHGGAVDSSHVKNGMSKARELAAGATVTGSFSCPGEVSVKVQAAVAEKNPKAPWLHDAPAAAGHPDENDLTALRKGLQDSFS
ncbi:flavodoxin family protein [Thiovibrio frasassiensis]|uniref:Flavodoxin family protein n=1 Tax=Thiovibrio frasassiensis TaxID=2984131 RepID=A0A9X4MHK9_9BACT|nr:flavodoxin family protein [Thiovibrio frasassiensis]MDG4474979.1 flavodoxin family protein [Thiovibrio frasassiensis]